MAMEGKELSLRLVRDLAAPYCPDGSISNVSIAGDELHSFGFDTLRYRML